jgi:uncharacterized membrane protein YfcA
METFVLFATGAASGLIAGLVGLAGGIVVVPALTWLYGTDALHDAIVISWFAVLFNSIGAAYKQYRIRSPEERREILVGSRYYMVGALIVTPLVAATLSSARHLVTPSLVALLQLCLAAVMLYPMKEGQEKRHSANLLDTFFGGLIGGVSTLIGVGGGTYTIAYFVYAAKRPFRDAIATANINGLVVGVLSVAGFLASLAYAPASASPHSTSPISTAGMVILIVTGVVFSSLGVRLSRRLPTAVLKKILIFALIASAIRLLVA